MVTEQRIAKLDEMVWKAIASANVLFQRTEGAGLRTRVMVHREQLEAYLLCLHAIRDELRLLSADDGSSKRYYCVVDGAPDSIGGAPDSIDYANHLVRASRERTFAGLLTECIWDIVRERLPAGTNDEDAAKNPQLSHAFEHAMRLFQVGVPALAEYMDLLREACAESADAMPSRLDPSGFGAIEEDIMTLCAAGTTLSADLVRKIREHIKSRDTFASSRTFRPIHAELFPGPLGEIRSLDTFYGYKKEQAFFAAHFGAFMRGEKGHPLLLSGMPGVGKTHLTIAFALSLNEMTLINAGQESLEAPLEELMDTLGRYHYRRFVLFFDDVDPENVDWSHFRNQVDGYLPYVGNVAIIIATNGEFSARIRSRCKVFEFRPMNPEVCQEFVIDYLEEHRWMSQPYPNLVSTVAADYASMFKRGILNELTPRSLIRYFEMLEGDKEKIRRLIRESLEEIVRVPSEEAFIESNKQVSERIHHERRGLLGLPMAPSGPAYRPPFEERRMSENR